MKDSSKTNPELIEEISSLRQRIKDLEASQTVHTKDRVDLWKSDSLDHAFFDLAPDPMAITDFDNGHIIDVNQAFVAWSHYSRDKLIGHTTEEIGFWVDDESRGATLARLNNAGFAGDVEIEFRRGNGEFRQVIFSGKLIEIENNKWFLSVAHDITERKQTEEALRESERKFLDLADKSVAGVYILQDGVFKYVNLKLAQIFGYKIDEIIDKLAVKDIIFPEDWPMVEENLRKKISGELESLQYEFRMYTKDQQVETIEIYSSRTIYHGRPAVIGTLLDITSRKQTEEALRDSQQQFQGLVETLYDWVWEVDSQGYYTYVSPQIKNILGYEPHEILGKTPFDLMIPEESRRVSVKFAALAKERKPIVALENINFHKDGRLVVLESNGLPFYDADGNFKGYRGTDRDITDRKQIEEALKDSEKKYKDLVQLLPEIIFECDTEGRLTFMNQAGYEIFGYSQEHINRGTNVLEFIAPDDRERARENIRRIVSGEGRRSANDYKALGGDGFIFAITVHSSPIMQNGKPAGLRGFIIDLTERKRIEEELLRARKLESLGILAGGIAHDFNNLMTVILGNVELAMMELPANHASYPLLNTVLQSTEQTKDLTSRLITFSKGDFLVKQISNISEVLRDAVQKIVRGNPIRVNFDIKRDFWPAEVDKTQIRQVFYNLTINAVEAMPEGGALTIRMHNTEVSLSDGLPLKEGPYLRITFTDNGPGITKEHLTHIFDPYFTTKGMGDQKGRGLGLSVCYSVLKKHGGHIAVTSRPGEGATFILYFPALIEKAKEAIQPLPSSRHRVLIVEDEVNVRSLERAFLAQLGYEVTEAKNGQEAIDRYKEALLSNNPFNLVVMNLVVHQGMGGQLTMERLMKENPSVRAIITSGHIDEPVIEHYKEYGFQGVLKKPFSFDQFKEIVKTVIDAET